jgi:hypothetical protein
MFSQSLERRSIIPTEETINSEPKVIKFTEVKAELESAGYTRDEIDTIVVEVSHTLPMLEMARKNLGNEHEINIGDVRIEIDIPNRRIVRVIDTKREQE